ncbi:hypothetical protein J6590_021712 [Homalodisca vitripennis]|nr:hypothetical protein J6590_021712 [Homalodisca vitripennis]
MADRMLSYCSSRQWTRKWTTRTIMHLFDLAISNSWLCYREDKIKSNIPLKKVAQLRKYKMDYGDYLIESNSILSDSEDSEYLTDEEVTPGRNPKELPSHSVYILYRDTVSSLYVRGNFPNRTIVFRGVAYGSFEPHFYVFQPFAKEETELVSSCSTSL